MLGSRGRIAGGDSTLGGGGKINRGAMKKVILVLLFAAHCVLPGRRMLGCSGGLGTECCIASVVGVE